jgi:hypothetical protein
VGKAFFGQTKPPDLAAERARTLFGELQTVASVLARAEHLSVPNRNGYYAYRTTIGKTKFAAKHPLDGPEKSTPLAPLDLAI